ncbi:MAG: TIR domain-containing protein [Thermoanaerobaculia bacterium]
MAPAFDVFLSHNSQDKPAVRKIAQALRDRSLLPWLDEWELIPGHPWQEALEAIIGTAQSAAILVGRDGLGSWEDREMRACLEDFVQRKLPVIPVLLPGAPEKPDLPLFLRAYTWVDLRGGLTDEGLDRLSWGITGRKPPDQPAGRSRRDVSLDFRFEHDVERDQSKVRLTAGDRTAEAVFAFDFADKHLENLRLRIENTQEPCSEDDLKEIGISLWTGLMTGSEPGPAEPGRPLRAPVGELFEALKQESGASSARYLFRLSLPHPRLELLPWEALYFDDYEGGAGFLACHPDYAVVRSPVAKLRAPSQPSPVHGQLRILAVIPEGSGLDVDREWRQLNRAVEPIREQVHLERLDDRVTPDRLAETLKSAHWDVVHFIGHGQQMEGGRATVRLNSADADEPEKWIDGESFGNLFIGRDVRLVVLNCCQGATPSLQRRMSGLGPFLLRAGVPAIVAMRYEMPDVEAIRFSERLYQELLTGDAPGRVDLAVESARESLERNQSFGAARPFVTPVLFLAGSEHLFALEPARRPAVVVVTPPPQPAAAPALPERLIRALRDGRCVPVVGPRVLTAGALRAGAPTADVRQLARTLAGSPYSRERDFKLCEAAGDWMDALLLQWVCGLAKKRLELYELMQTIQDAYASCQPPAILSLMTEWSVPGVFYLHFDGLLEEAFAASRRPVRVVYGVDEQVPTGTAPLLVHVRGSHRKAESIVLTEEDHEALWDRVGKMTPEITNLVRGHNGRSLLFLGVNPRDPLVRRLFSKLLEGWSDKLRGPIFFLCREEEKDDPYWEAKCHPSPFQWIEGELESFVPAVTRALAEEEGS